MNRLSTIIIVLLISTFGIVSTVSAQESNAGPVAPTPTPVANPAADRVGKLLSAHHELPSKARFEAIEGARQTLAEMATNRAAPLGQKRALEALAYWPTATTLGVYTAVLNDPQTRVGTRHLTLMLVGRHFATDALDVLAPYLGADDVQLRLTAVEAIALTQTPEGVELLGAHAQVETSRLVLDAIEAKGRVLR